MSAFVLKTWQIFFAFFSLALAFRTYYDILGVSKTAKEHEIKRAFRRLALKLHPDRNKESNAEAKFREIAEAYETLTDAQKRQQYDAGGFYHHQQQQQQQNEQGGAHKHAESSKFKFDYNEFYKKFDESFKSFRQGARDKQKQTNADYKFESHGHSFNFEDLWDESDEEFWHEFDELFGANPEFGKQHFAQHFAHHSAHKHMHPGAGGGGGADENCRTISKKVGNSITTHTECVSKKVESHVTNHLTGDFAAIED